MRKLKWMILIQLCVISLKPLPNAASQEKLTTPTIQGKDLNLTIVYDNNPYDNRLDTRWGFSCYIQGTDMIVMGICIILGKGCKIPIGNKMLNRGIESMLLFGFLMGVAPCVPYVAILTYIACIAENDVLAGMLYATVFL